ncbi:MAG: SAVED domain-containing protein [Chloroflexi bacterium]|nr:SAVED domain-containing protein [Chloroflexota bacterium]
MITQGFDPVTLNHWLWFKYQCHECSPADFQRLFENIIKRAKPDFMQIRPYGNIGDRKCDGIFLANTTVFQVYSPDELTLSEVQKKIDEDLDGAVKHWGDAMKKWVFVYNVRRGLPPDIPMILQRKQAEYPAIIIEHLSSDGLWEMARGLTLQQRAEILGAPAGYEHLFAPPTPTEESVRNSLASGWFVIVHPPLSPINIPAVTDALRPDLPFCTPITIQPGFGPLPWVDAAAYQREAIRDILRKRREFLPRFAVFSLSPIPLALHLGFTLSDRVEVRCFQYDRERNSWNWPDDVQADIDTSIQVTGLPTGVVLGEPTAIVRVSLSAPVAKADTDAITSGADIQVNVFVSRPDVMWLRSPKQLVKLGRVFRDVLTAVRTHAPGCSRIHLFYAGPTPGAVVIGQQINPRMNPPVDLYEYSHQARPRYQWALTLQESV